MMSKKLKAISVIAAFALLVALPAKAASHDDVDNAGITPDSPFYFLDQFGEWIQDIFSFSDSAKAETAISHATERIAELKALHESGNLNSEQIKNLVEKYQELLNEYKESTESDSSKNEEEKNEIFDEALEKHIEVLDEIFEDEKSDFSDDVINALERAEDEEDDIIEDKAEESEDESLEYFKIKAERKIESAESKVAKAAGFIAENPSEEGQTQLERATLFLDQAKEAMTTESYFVAYGLARQSKAIAEHIRFPEKGEELIDKISEKGTKTALDAEEKIAKALALLDSADLSEEERAELERLIDEAIARLAESEQAFTNEEFYAGHVLAKFAKKIASQVVDSLEGEDEFEDEIEDELENAGLSIEDIVAGKIKKARESIEEAQRQIDTASDGENKDSARAQLARAQSLLNEAEKYFASQSYALSLMFAKSSRKVSEKIDDVLEGKEIEEDEMSELEKQELEREIEVEKQEVEREREEEKESKNEDDSFDDEKDEIEKEVEEKKDEIENEEEKMENEIEKEDNSGSSNDEKDEVDEVDEDNSGSSNDDEEEDDEEDKEDNSGSGSSDDEKEDNSGSGS